MAQITGQYVCAAGGNSFQPNVVTITYVSIKPRFVEDYFEKATKIERYFGCEDFTSFSDAWEYKFL